MHRSISLLATAAVLGLTGVALLGLAAVQRPISFDTPAGSPDNETVVRRFYDAVNAAIATGDPSAIRAVVASDLVEHESAPGMATGRAGLEEHLVALHASSPDLRLSVEAVVAAGDRAMAKVAASNSDGVRFLGNTLAEQPAGWGPVDLFRVMGGQVVERWGSTAGLVLLGPGIEASVEIDIVTRRAFRVERLSFTPGARIDADATRALRLLYVETGELVVKPQGGTGMTPALVAAGRTGAPDAGKAIEPGETVRLAANELLVVPDNVAYAAWNDGREAARMVVVALLVPISWSRAAAPQPAAVPPGVTTETLAASSALDISPGTVSVALGRASLAPGGRLSLPDLEAPAAVVVQAGDLRFASTRAVWVTEGDDGSMRTRTAAALDAGDGVYLSRDAGLTLANDGMEPADVLMVALRLPPPGDPAPELAGQGHPRET